ncbi:hypothetical protein MML48_2g00013261 [Holotrichia oblita]|uniref:Uncharacterized protein n=1 Tax=Holotrichia oblita TaxID=644536 RepID=A0ACB9TMV7_HOLOL|nr:hypothetical protein MML48_2g00013261 [Holotrichia oblita]
MVRRKKERSRAKFTGQQMTAAGQEVKTNGTSLRVAAEMFNINFLTLRRYVLKERDNPDAKMVPNYAVRLVFEPQQDALLCSYIKPCSKMGFGLDTSKVRQLAYEMADGFPGEEWFLGFKKRNNLSLKIPQNVEYARKKAMDPFTIHNYFSLLKDQLDNLALHNKPSQIWNLDETSLSIDPRRSKVVGEIGKPSSRTISTPGKENTTVLALCNAEGKKAPPLIIFKGRHLWDKWIAPAESSYPGIAYAATKKGWIEGEVFRNYLMKTVIPALGHERPTLIVYDHNSTHLDPTIIEAAIKENITIIKFPPHASHLLQPLDLSVFKSFKCKWDAKLIAWQRQHVGQKLPKNVFSQFVCDTWKLISPEVISNGFRKAGIHPFNDEVIPRDSFAPAALKRFEEHKNMSIETSQAETIIRSENDVPVTPPPLLEITRDSSPAATTAENVPTSTTSIVSLPQNNHNISLEELLLSTIRQTPTVGVKQKKTRVCFGSEVLTTNDVLQRLKEKTSKNRRESSSTSSDEDIGTGPRYIESDQSEEFWNDLEEELAPESSTDSVIGLGKWILVKYCTKKYVKHYIGQIIEKIDLEWKVK